MDYEAEVVDVDTGKSVETPTEEAETKPEVVEEESEEVDDEESEDTEEEEAPTEEPVKAEEDNLVELPDGRKLPPKEAEKEYRNLYSEFTRKSQKLATYEKGDSKIKSNNETEKEKEEWIPQTWEEVLEKSKQALKEDFAKEKQVEQEYRQQNEKMVLGQLEEIKKENPTLNESLLFNHALKYNFTDLKLAYSNFKDMQSSIKKATETTAKNIQKRNAEPISGGQQGGEVSDGDVYDPSIRNMSATDYLRSLK